MVAGALLLGACGVWVLAGAGISWRSDCWDAAIRSTTNNRRQYHLTNQIN